MLIRRRMMGETGEPSPLLFSIENVAVSAGDSISTGVKPFAADQDITILVDFTLTSRPTSGNGANFKLIYCGSTFTWGTRNATTSTTALYFYWFSTTSYNNAGTSVTDGARYRICVTHTHASNYVYVKTKKGTNAIENKSKSATFSPSQIELCLGNPNGTQGTPNGTISSCKVYNYVFSADEIADFFAD